MYDIIRLTDITECLLVWNFQTVITMFVYITRAAYPNDAFVTMYTLAASKVMQTEENQHHVRWHDFVSSWCDS